VDNVLGGGSKTQNRWEITHGDPQYQWLKQTLEQSTARWKFVFAHHVIGTGRGGIEVAPFYEWGGKNDNGNWGFATNRPAWAMPIHQLMVANHVTIFFQGHDHLFARQELDGVVYQELPEPADPTYTFWNADAYTSGDRLPNTGYVRVDVSPFAVKVEYVKTYLPKDETAAHRNGEVAFSYTIVTGAAPGIVRRRLTQGR
jgi:phosphodiesterase/alkaline phosphatase D-like protein